MEARTEPLARGAPLGAPEAAHEPKLDLRCRVCELEEENARLRLLVGELLVANQRLREEAKATRAD
jgi:hypothetical protein